MMILFVVVSKKTLFDSGFTIVELLVVVVVIGILAALTIVSYTGISQRAVEASLKSDLVNASNQLKLFQVTSDSESYPDTISCGIPDSTTNKCIKPSGSNEFTYTPSNGTNPKTFILDVTDINNFAVYRITNNSAPEAVVDPYAADPNWTAGIASTVLEGKYVRKTDLGFFAYKTTATNVTSPQGAINLDPSYMSKMSLVDPQENPTVDFSEYPAQNACKAVNGRLPTVQEIQAMYTDKTTYGNFSSDLYMTATESNTTFSYSFWFSTGALNVNNKTFDNKLVRCVAG